MIRYEHPVKIKRFPLAALQFWTGDVPEYEDDPSARIHAHYNAILAAQNGTLSGEFNGAAFEVAINDAVRVRRPSLEVRYGYDPTPRKLNADIDLYLPELNVAFLSKTSLRERWKQVDRDARLIADVLDASVYGLFLCEKPVKGKFAHPKPRRACLDFCPERAMKLGVQKTRLLSAKGTELVTVLDEVKMRKIWDGL